MKQLNWYFIIKCYGREKENQENNNNDAHTQEYLLKIKSTKSTQKRITFILLNTFILWIQILKQLIIILVEIYFRIMSINVATSERSVRAKLISLNGNPIEFWFICQILWISRHIEIFAEQEISKHESYWSREILWEL